MVKYNRGRFIFMFDPITRKLSAIYDTNYDTLFTKDNPGFLQVYGAAIESLDNESLGELKESLKDEPRFKHAIDKIIRSRNDFSK